jgi:hypothetical protein
MSAVVKPGGITCYSAHADKGFYTWADLLGSDFVKDFLATAYTEATRDCYWDGRAYWRKTAMGAYDSFEKEDFKLFLRGACKLSNKPGPSGLSPVEEALSHIQEHNKVRSAGPFVLRRQGIVDFNGERSLNIYNKKPIEPAPKTSWGPHGEFPFFSMYLPALFDPYEIQFAFAVTWLQQFYRSALEWDPVPGHSIILCGGTGCGKGLWNRSIVGASVGGFADAEGYLVRGESFNSHMMNAAHWVLDDDAPANSPGSRAKLAAALKKMAANQEFFNHEKFKVPGMVERMGRTGITCNLDFTSMRLICGSLDTSALDKLCLFKCVAKRMIDFPERRELAKIIARELPYFLRWVLDFVPPDFVQQAIKDDNRFGFKAYHNEELLDRSMQGSAVAPLKETLVEVLMMWFRDNAEAKEWSGTVTQIIRFIEGSGLNSDFARKYSPEQVNRYLEQMQSQKLLPISSNTGAHNMRIWTFQRIEGDLNFNNTSTPGVSFESPRPLPPEVK